ncbi:caspase family protein [Bacteroides sp.]|uniref:caspase family protein n=1 Tax=Bacteroides sp. TaxID=29523 RepID=UPI0023BF830F|nr:caspase family protein [Bacteroides sp.]MDE6215990.1 caspase family protein [Bacteroides sp.]
MKKTILSIFFAGISMCMMAQTMHTLIFVNEKEAGREVDRTADSRNMKQFFTNVAQCLGYAHNLRSHSGSEFTTGYIDREIDNLHIGGNDVVVFYYSGHGANLKNDKWPTLDLLDQPYWSSHILARLNKQCGNAKLILFITDCCNGYLNNGYKPVRSYNPTDDNNVARLFIGFKGKKKVIVTAAKPGQFSYSHLTYGAFFGNAFRQAVKENTSNDVANPTWEKVLQDASKLTIRFSAGKHEPQYSIEQSADPFDD